MANYPLKPTGAVVAVIHPDNLDATPGMASRTFQGWGKQDLTADLQADFAGVIDGSSNNTTKIANAQAALQAKGGGTLTIGQGDCVGFVEKVDHVRVEGQGYGITNLFPPDNSRPGVITLPDAPCVGSDLVNLSVCGDNNADQWGIYAQGGGGGGAGDGGWWYSTIDVHMGDGLTPGGVWLRGGGEDGLNPHQFLKIRLYARDEVGRADWLGLWVTGQVGQVMFDLLELDGDGGTTPTTELLMRIEREVNDSGTIISDAHAYTLGFNEPSIQGARRGVYVDRCRVLRSSDAHFENVMYPIEITNSAVDINFDVNEFADCGLDNGDGAIVTVGGTSWGTLSRSTWQGTGDGPDNIVTRSGPGALIEHLNNWPAGHSSTNRIYALGISGGLDFSNHRYVGIVGDGATTVQQMTNTIAEGEVFTVLALSGDVLYNQSGNLVIPQGTTHVLTQKNGSISQWIRQGVKLWLIHGGEGGSIA